MPEAISKGEDSDENGPVTLIEEEFVLESQRRPMIIVQSAGKRQRSLSVDSDETIPHLPSTIDQGGTRRRSGLRGMRKCSKPDDVVLVLYDQPFRPNSSRVERRNRAKNFLN